MDSITFKAITDIEECKNVLLHFSKCLRSLQEKDAIGFYAAKFSKNANVIVAENIEKKCMGFIAYYANDLKSKTAYITMIATLPEYRGKHIGQSLMDYCKKDISAKDFSFIRLEVGKDNLIAQHFYKKNGFVNIGENEKYMMEWKLLSATHFCKLPHN